MGVASSKGTRTAVRRHKPAGRVPRLAVTDPFALFACCTITDVVSHVPVRVLHR